MDIDKWKTHFKRMATGSLRADYHGKYLVKGNQIGGTSSDANVKFVTPVAQAVELAKSELKEEKDYKGRRHALKRKIGSPGIKTKRSKISDALC